MQDFKILCTKILSLTKEIENFVEKNDIEKIDKILAKRKTIIEELLKIKSERTADKELDEIIQQIKKLDEKNFKKLATIKQEIKEQLTLITKNTKAIAGYKTKTTHRSRLVDETDI